MKLFKLIVASSKGGLVCGRKLFLGGICVTSFAIRIYQLFLCNSIGIIAYMIDKIICTNKMFMNKNCNKNGCLRCHGFGSAEL